MTSLEELQQQHRGLYAAMPRTWTAFFGRFGSSRPVQLAAMPKILTGLNTLVTAPTAGGKTEAVVAPICERLLAERWPGLSVLLITPTRALVNDLYARLEKPLAELRIGLGRKTSDHAQWDHPRVQFVVTTPESTESLLTFNRDAIANVRAIILDEIHLLAGSPRGDQLQLVLQRLSRFVQYRGGEQFAGLQRVALSATVAAPECLAAAFLGRESQIVSVPGQRTIEGEVLTDSGDERSRIAVAMSSIDRLPDVRKVLVFVNSRKSVDESAAHFQIGRFRNVPIFGHHGSLSKTAREQAEQRFQDAESAICVATTTLEVGIDIGDIDLVVCLDPPYSLSSFLQRIGRGCRRRKGATRVLCVARDRGSELIFQALIQQASLGMPRAPRTPFRRSVLFQQILAYLRQVDQHRRTYKQIRECLLEGEIPPLNESDLRRILSEMSAEGWLDCENEIYRPASRGRDFIDSNRIFSNIAPTPPKTEVIDADTGKAIATVAAIDRSPGVVRIAGKSYDVLPGGTSARQRVRASEQMGASPHYHVSRLPYAFDIGASLANLLLNEPGKVLFVQVGDSLNVFTWLGAMLNAALAATMKRVGCAVTGGAFHLQIPNGERERIRILDWIRRAVAELCRENSLHGVQIQSLIDLGPNFEFLSAESRRLAQQDWLDRDFLQGWATNLSDCQEIMANSDLGCDLLTLVKS